MVFICKECSKPFTKLIEYKEHMKGHESSSTIEIGQTTTTELSSPPTTPATSIPQAKTTTPPTLSSKPPTTTSLQNNSTFLNIYNNNRLSSPLKSPYTLRCVFPLKCSFNFS